MIRKWLGGKEIKELSGHSNTVTNVTVNHLLNFILTVSSECCHLWGLADFKKKKSFYPTKGKIVSAAFDTSGSLLSIFSDSGHLTLWSMQDFIQEKEIKFPLTAKVESVASSFQADFLFAYGPMPYIVGIDLKTHGIQCFQPPFGNNSIKKLKFIKGNTCLFLGDSGQLYLNRFISTESKERQFEGFLKVSLQNKAIINFECDLFGDFLVAVSNDGVISLLSLKNILSFGPGFVQSDKNLILVESFVAHWSPTDPSNISQNALDFQKNGPVFLMSETPESKNLFGGFKEDPPATGLAQAITTSHSANFKNPCYQFKTGQTMQKGKHQKEKTLEKIKTFKREEEPTIELDSRALKIFWQKHYKFPDDYRPHIWAFCLGLPQNHQDFLVLSTKEAHPSIQERFDKKFKLADQKTQKKLRKLMSMLAHYNEIFGHLDVLPILIFPFVKLLGQNEIICFETILSYLFHWGQFFFDYLPHPPLKFLREITKVIESVDYELATHLKESRIHLHDCLWPIVLNNFTDVFEKSEWLCLFDGLVANNESPELFLLVSAALILMNKSPIMKMSSSLEVLKLFHQQRHLTAKQTIQKAFELLSSLKTGFLEIPFHQYLPLQKGGYLPFPFHPRLVDVTTKSLKN